MGQVMSEQGLLKWVHEVLGRQGALAQCFVLGKGLYFRSQAHARELLLKCSAPEMLVSSF